MKRFMPFVLSVAVVATAGLIAVQGQTKKTKTRPSAAVQHRPLGAARQLRSNFALTRSPEGRRQAAAEGEQAAQLHQKARTLLKEGKLEEAEQAWREEVAFWQAHDTTSAGTDQLLGDIQLAQGKYKEALATYAIVLRSSDNPQIFLGIAQCYLRLGDLEKSREALQESPDEGLRKLADDPLPEDLKDMPGTHDLKAMEATLMMVLAASTSDGYEEELKYLQAAEKLSPENWFIADRIGQTLDRLNQYDKAVVYYRRSMQLGGDKVSYDHRMRVEMFDLRQKQNKQKVAQ